MLPELSEEQVRHRIARRIALDLEDGSFVNLGIGIPTLVSDYLPEGTTLLLQTENGAIGAGPKPEVDDWRFIAAGGRCVTLIPGASCVASDMSFGMIRGGHLDATVLGALEVDQEGNLANWWIPGKMVPGMGGAMDLVCGAKKVYVATSHTDKKGRPKLLKKCSLPLTAVGAVDVVVSEFAVVRRIEGRMTLCELAPEVTLEQLLEHTEMELASADPIVPMLGV
ncbi:3-oxoacid CoA-transferase subunit B [uncultured Fretibacterium sp.]|uniref:3-oxoacid CoA-transferase subunit B n=1 Tax=uncultured Fretibacterium sp. TaxID=1678694 RepID=UPI0026123CF8|nr:3-oxoacid CoA-transferase subunit B [uncultured Fretibacterium sp.]